MIRTNLFFAAGLFLSLGSLSCSKKHPYLKVNAPLNGQVFTAPEVITIDAKMSDPDILLGKDLLVIKDHGSFDTVINIKEPNIPEEHFVRSFVSEHNTTYTIIVTVHGGYGWKSDTLVVRAN